MVNLRQGTLLGIKLYTESKAGIIAYLGVPYAQPPVGELRFSPPERHVGWDRSLFAGSFQSICPQPINKLVPSMGGLTRQDEDCLYLNIWTTDLAMNYRNAPVVVFFEGEGFVAGAPSRFPAQDLAAEGLVVVSVAYRLNVFGFFCLEDLEARGNLGLLDQYLALIWVHENIAAFGGDPRSVTLMGHSAGATSVVYHMISPRTANLFHRAIVMSGSVMSPWSHAHRPANASRAVARSLGCLSVNQTHQILSCLRNKSATEILRAFETQYMEGNWTNTILPVSDDFLPDIEQYLPKTPLEALTEGSFLKIPVLTGVTSHEGVVAISHWGGDLETQGYSQLLQLFSNSVLPMVMSRYGFHSQQSRAEILSILRWQYIDPVRPGDTAGLIAMLTDFYTDAQFKAPHLQQLRLLAKTDIPVYAYQFEQGGIDLYGKNFNISGAGHGAEMVFIFGPTLIQSALGRRFNSVEERLSIAIKRIWAEFIRQGSLGSNPYGYGVSWRKYSAEEDNYIILKAVTSLQPIDRSQQEVDVMSRYRISLWNELLPKIRNITITPVPSVKNGVKGMQLTTDQPYRSAMYTLIGFVIVLLILLIVCVILLKRRAKERERDLF
ncbi:carboxylesterase 4A [Macrosteles quadrilineatus]|uniref:carboxylesterase 4A n=1 Tax=Macrosteles quadrilineatus TaxID=74068 RepID=UPI0023E14B36|nr:carboxylesterase 4A [Macrosteles quadrilineatus]